jgi:SAM-dependent methyltransferase
MTPQGLPKREPASCNGAEGARLRTTADRIVSDEQERAIRAVSHFARGVYRDIDINWALDFYQRRYIGPLGAFVDIRADDVVADIGTGYGWLAIAFALCTPARIVAVDNDEARLEAARAIASILRVADRIDWRLGALGQLPLVDREARVAYCIEVIEHIGRSRPAIHDLGRICDEVLVITSPNLLFPIIAHDTRLPFCHWLPLGLRARYAALCGRSSSQHSNLFWSPMGLLRELPDFNVTSRFLHYSSRRDYLATFPLYMPYVDGGMRRGDGYLKSIYYAAASLLGRYSLYVMPSLACTLRRASENRPRSCDAE